MEVSVVVKTEVGLVVDAVEFSGSRLLYMLAIAILIRRFLPTHA